MTKLNPVWAVEELDKFVQMTAQYVPHGPGFISAARMHASQSDAAAQALVVERILDRIPGFGGWRTGRPAAEDVDFRWLRDQAARGKVAIEREDELAANLGDGAPEMDAANLHPWAWDSGKAFWHTGHYHQAVMAASQRINAETQAKLGLTHPGESKLFQQAFSTNDPQTDQPRLRLMRNDGSDNFKNVHQGARALGEGLYWALRNTGMHAPPPADGGEEQLALEQLAAFSLLARWVDQAEVEKV